MTRVPNSPDYSHEPTLARPFSHPAICVPTLRLHGYVSVLPRLGRQGWPAEGPADRLPRRLHGPGVAVGRLQRPAPAGAAVLPLAADESGPGRLGRYPADPRVPVLHAGCEAGERDGGPRPAPG